MIESFTYNVLLLVAQQTGGTGLAGAAAPGAGGAAFGAGMGPILESKSLLGYIAAGGFVAIVLIMLSAAAVGLIIASGIMLRKSALAKPATVGTLEMLLREKRVDQAIGICRGAEHDCFLTRVLGAGLTKARSSQFGLLEAKSVMEEVGRREADRLDRTVYAIRVVADLAPMLGLLGTVIGIIKAFATIGGAEGASRSSQLSANMSEALVNTALGLGIAIPCLLFHAFFKRRGEAMVNELAEMAEHLMGLLSQPGGAVQTQQMPQAQQPRTVPTVPMVAMQPLPHAGGTVTEAGGGTGGGIGAATRSAGMPT